MRIVFGWNRINLKTYTFEELNLEPIDQFPDAQIRVAQSYFHLFFIPVFPMGKRYDLVMKGQAYHIPPSLRNSIDPEKLKARGKWYAWSLPILAILIFLGVKINGMYTDYKYKKVSMEYAEMQKKFFDDPFVGDHIHFSDNNTTEFDAEVFSYNDQTKKVMLFIDLLAMQDEKLLSDAEKGLTKGSPDTLRTLLADRDELVESSVFKDSLTEEYPNQPIFRRLLTLELEEFPINYKFIEMTLAQYKNLKKSIGDPYHPSKAIKIAAFNEITKSRLFVEPQ